MDKRREIIQEPLLSRSARIEHDPTSKGSLRFPVVEGQHIGTWTLAKVIRAANPRIDRQRLSAYFDRLNACVTKEDFLAALKEIDQNVSVELDALPESAVSKEEGDLESAFITGRVLTRFLLDKVFPDFDETRWEQEFRERLQRKTSRTDESYGLADFFKEKCDEAFTNEPLRSLVEARREQRPSADPKAMVRYLVNNFRDGMRDIPHLQTISSSVDDLKTHIRKMMHLNGSSQLFQTLLEVGGAQTYLWKSLSEVLTEARASMGSRVRLACNPETILKSAQGVKPTFTCPMHYLPEHVFNGLVNLMVKYPAVENKRHRG